MERAHSARLAATALTTVAALCGCSPDRAPSALASETLAPDSIYWDYPEAPYWADHPTLVLADERSRVYPDLPDFPLALSCADQGHLEVSGTRLMAWRDVNYSELPSRMWLSSHTARFDGRLTWRSENGVDNGDLLLRLSREELGRLLGGGSFTVVSSYSDGDHAEIYPAPPSDMAQAFLAACHDEAEHGASN